MKEIENWESLMRHNLFPKDKQCNDIERRRANTMGDTQAR